MLLKNRLKIDDTVELRVSRPQTTATKHALRDRDSDEAIDRNIRIPELKTIEVSGLTKEITKEYLEMYFESRKKSGGGRVDEVTVRGQSALVTFINPDGKMLAFYMRVISPLQ